MTYLCRAGWNCISCCERCSRIFERFGHELLKTSSFQRNQSTPFSVGRVFLPKCSEWSRTMFLGTSNKKSKRNCGKKRQRNPKNSCACKDDVEKEKKINENPCKGKENLVAILYKDHDLKFEERAKPKPCPGEVLIAMNCVGISYSDLNYYTKGKLPTPLVLGSEGTGIVAGLGQGVRNLREGDRVTIEPDIYCGHCEYCKKFKHHLCAHGKSCGLVPYDGLLTCYKTHNADHCYKLPECITMEEGVLINMLAKGINVCSRCRITLGTSVLVIGAGPIGLASLIASQAVGATNTCVMCQFTDRLKLAKNYNTKTVQISKQCTPEDMAQFVREQLGCSPDVTIDTAGSENSLKLAIASTAPGGTIVLANVANGVHKIPLFEAAHKDLSIRSALRHAHKFPAAIALAKRGQVNLKSLISHHFYFEEADKAIAKLMENKETANKVIVHIRPRDRNNKHEYFRSRGWQFL